MTDRTTENGNAQADECLARLQAQLKAQEERERADAILRIADALERIADALSRGERSFP